MSLKKLTLKALKAYRRHGLGYVFVRGFKIAEKGFNLRMLRLFNRHASDREIIFRRIYGKDCWGHGSGPGSSIEVTAQYRTFLKRFMIKKKIKTVLDIGCGDWQFSHLIDWTGIDYVGIDIVPSLIEQNNAKFGRNNIKFQVRDAVVDSLPRADLVILKDILQHLSNDSILRVLSKVRCKFALVAENYTKVNRDCDDGGYRPLNLSAQPFDLKGEVVMWIGKRKRVVLLRNLNGLD